MYEVINSFKSFLGLDAQPMTVVELIVWFVLMCCAVAVLSGMIKLMWHMSLHTKEIFK